MAFSHIVPDWPFAPSAIGCLSTERSGGISRAPYDDGQGGGGLNLGMHVGDDPSDVRKNRERLQSMLPSTPIWLAQVHGSAVMDADELDDTESPIPPEADAIVTSVPKRVCVIQTADCLPVLFCDVAGKVVGAAHAGWRGLAAGILENTICHMRHKGAQEISAWLGPAIGAQRFEVGQDVLNAFTRADSANAAAFRESLAGSGKYLADIYLLAKMILQKEGVTRIVGGSFCTVEEKKRFYSYRRDGVTGRMASFIWLK